MTTNLDDFLQHGLGYVDEEEGVRAVRCDTDKLVTVVVGGQQIHLDLSHCSDRYSAIIVSHWENPLGKYSHYNYGAQHHSHGSHLDQ